MACKIATWENDLTQGENVVVPQENGFENCHMPWENVLEHKRMIWLNKKMVWCSKRILWHHERMENDLGWRFGSFFFQQTSGEGRNTSMSKWNIVLFTIWTDPWKALMQVCLMQANFTASWWTLCFPLQTCRKFVVSACASNHALYDWNDSFL